MIKGKKVGLIAIERKMLEKLKEWRNNPELRKVFREYRELNSDHQEKWFESKIMNDSCTVMFAIKPIKWKRQKRDDDHIIGVCGLCYIDWIHRLGEFSIYIGDDKYTSGGYGSEALRLLCAYGFDNLNLHKIWGEIYTLNEQRYEMFKHIGFQDEGLLKEVHFHEGKYYDSHMVGMFRKEYEEYVLPKLKEN